MKVFLVENSALIVGRLTEMLGALPGVEVVGHAAGAEEAARQILKARPEVVLLDLELDQGTGIGVLMNLRDTAPEIDVYVFTNYVTKPLREAAAQLGAKGFYDKSQDFNLVRELIARRAAEAGGGAGK